MSKDDTKKTVEKTEATQSNASKEPKNEAEMSEGKDGAEAKPAESVPKGQMMIKVYSPFRSYYEGLGLSISGANETGPFDILAGHHRFLTLLSACELDIKAVDGSEIEKIKIDRGIMYVKEDRVTVFLDV